MHLQKILYYVQGFSLAFLGKPAFAERIRAWKFGPVVESVYARYAPYGPLYLDEEGTPDPLDGCLRAVVSATVPVICEQPAFVVSHYTHGESPWRETFHETNGDIIPNEKISRFFRFGIFEKASEFEQGHYDFLLSMMERAESLLGAQGKKPKITETDSVFEVDVL